MVENTLGHAGIDQVSADLFLTSQLTSLPITLTLQCILYLHPAWAGRLPE